MAAMKRLSSQYPRYGYRRIWIFLDRKAGRERLTRQLGCNFLTWSLPRIIGLSDTCRRRSSRMEAVGNSSSILRFLLVAFSISPMFA